MAKLRDTAIKDNLNIAGNVTAAGKVLSVEGHTHTPASITGIDKYIEDKVKAGGATLPENIDAKTLEGHAASDFVLKTESTGGNTYTKLFYANCRSNVTTFTFNKPLYESKIIFRTKFWEVSITMTDGSTPTYIVSKYLRNMDQIIMFETQTPTVRVIKGTNLVVELQAGYTVVDIEVVSKSNIEDLKVDLSFSLSRINYSQEYPNIYHNTHIVPEWVYVRSRNIFLYRIKNVATSFATNLLNNNTDDGMRFALYDLDKDIILSTDNSNYQLYGLNDNTIFSYNPEAIFIKSEKFSNNIVIASNVNIFAPSNKVGRSQFTVTISSAERTDSWYMPLAEVKKVFEVNSISATINGVQFDGKTNITTPATKLITPVHINGIEFDGSQDITIPAPTNALTLGGLDSGQYIKVTDVGNAAGKIPRFDNDGFLVYPDGSKERIENG